MSSDYQLNIQKVFCWRALTNTPFAEYTSLLHDLLNILIINLSNIFIYN